MKARLSLTIISLLLCFTMIVGCGSSSVQVSDNSTPTETSVLNSSGISFDNFDSVVSNDVEKTVSALTKEYEGLIKDIDTYEKYLKSVDKVEAFYTRINEVSKQLCIRMCEYSLSYAELIMASEKSNSNKYNTFEEIYNTIYDDAGEKIYDGIYDGILDDLYKYFYDGILDDAYDRAEYEEWSDASSDEYDWWSDTRSDVYDDWSDFRSDIYDFWSDIRGDLYDNDLDDAQKELQDFRETIEKMKEKCLNDERRIK